MTAQKKLAFGYIFSGSPLVNMVLNFHRNHKAYQGREEGEARGMEVGEEGDYIPVATLSPPE